jgi:hypothetical protein
MIVSLVDDDFRGQVLCDRTKDYESIAHNRNSHTWCAAHGPCSIKHTLGEAKVSELQVTCNTQCYCETYSALQAAHTAMINENILRLQVAVHNVEVVQVLDSQHSLGTEKSRLLFVEVSVSLALHQCEHLAAVDILENKVQRARCDPGG